MREKKSAEEVSKIRRELALARWAKLAPPATASIRVEADLARLVREYARLAGKRASEIVSAALRAYFDEAALLFPDLYRRAERIAGAAHSAGRAQRARTGAAVAGPGGGQSRNRVHISR